VTSVASIDHGNLEWLLARKLEVSELLALIRCIIDTHQGVPGKSLPIDALEPQAAAATIGRRDSVGRTVSSLFPSPPD
jgi:hypothetical protein